MFCRRRRRIVFQQKNTITYLTDMYKWTPHELRCIYNTIVQSMKFYCVKVRGLK